MYHENEIVMLFLCTGVLLFVIFNRKKLIKYKKWNMLYMSFLLFFIACVSTVLEGFLFEGIFNHTEHFCYAGSGIVLVIWCFKIFMKKDRV